MTLRVLIPAAVALDRPATAISACTERGSFRLLPRHRDCVIPLAPGILSARAAGGHDDYYAVDGGMLVKCGPSVVVSTRRFVGPATLGTLKRTVQERFQTLDEREKKARSTIAKLEAALARQLLDLKHHARL